MVVGRGGHISLALQTPQPIGNGKAGGKPEWDTFKCGVQDKDSLAVLATILGLQRRGWLGELVLVTQYIWLGECLVVGKVYNHTSVKMSNKCFNIGEKLRKEF